MSCNHPWSPFTPSTYYDGFSYYEVLAKLCGRMCQMEKWISENLEGAINEYFNKIMVDAIYDEDTETITLKKEISVKANTHTYEPDERSMKIT